MYNEFEFKLKHWSIESGRYDPRDVYLWVDGIYSDTRLSHLFAMLYND